MDKLTLTVIEARAETAQIRSLRLAPADGGRLPAWQPGAHVNVLLPSGDERSYSLIHVTADPQMMVEPQEYLLAVRLEPASTGGSAYIHSLKIGDVVTIRPPTNNFRLEPAAQAVVLVAGGIGITPMLAMAGELEARRHPYRFFYAGRRRRDMAFLAEAQALAGVKLTVHADDENGGVFDLAGLMNSLGDGEPLYLCGPTGMIEAAIATAARLGWRERRLRFEIFDKPQPRQGDSAFEVVLQHSGKRFTVPPDKTILDVLIEAGEDPIFDCKRGECGICQIGVISGDVDHRDYCLSDAEKAANRTMQICVSRAKSKQLVLDM
jgi:vanillate O-demethylase ferredoxin subunit